ncbi:WhiB family transcriptional regulator [Kitasatospora sp. RB6PN24]|uniref:WhiB family transcriptional regulator n=1 Tax=Kitasatospora humi TaxID=2893891 RepID=UPI001E61CEC4|nr:WhiB family transcriptional regulator [Kitasatospora humi]MCC9307736.1 WhiB family transcriptional regulator [Kitasatospora humi]
MTATLRANTALPCQADPDLFFAPDGVRDTRQRVDNAKALCQLCPIRVACREEGRRLRAAGIWGGEDDTERGSVLAALGPAPAVEASATAAPARRQPPEHGTRPGYQRRRRRGETACEPCRIANTQADRRLRTTGSTKAPA